MVISTGVGEASSVGTGRCAYRICFQPSPRKMSGVRKYSMVFDGNWDLAVRLIGLGPQGPRPIRRRVSEQQGVPEVQCAGPTGVWTFAGTHEPLSQLWVK